MKEYFVDYRFIVKANDEFDAGKKVLDYLPDSTDDIWYALARIIPNPESKQEKLKSSAPIKEGQPS